jgi:hypothetical protein
MCCTEFKARRAAKRRVSEKNVDAPTFHDSNDKRFQGARIPIGFLELNLRGGWPKLDFQPGSWVTPLRVKVTVEVILTPLQNLD